jgi:2-polyprenyl-3-methyl-5-hydroxy-6-metoxy-1,4-benzoquinol methylase
MNPVLYRAWKNIVIPDELDDHMHVVGQAAANAALLESMLYAAQMQPNSRILIGGAGTAQFLDYVPSAVLANHDIIVSDINIQFLEVARRRFARAGLSRVQFVVDDLESTQISGPLDVVLLVLVLEHIDWRIGLKNIAALGRDNCLLSFNKIRQDLAKQFQPIESSTRR